MEGFQWKAGQPGSQEHVAPAPSSSLHPSLPPFCTSHTRSDKHRVTSAAAAEQADHKISWNYADTNIDLSYLLAVAAVLLLNTSCNSETLSKGLNSWILL